MPHIARPDANDLQPDRGEHDRLERAFDGAPGVRASAEQRAYAAQRLAALGEMTGGIAHDIRNLLAVIESGLGLAEKSLEQPDKVRVYIAAARQGIDRGVKLTSQLLAFAKRQELEARAGDVNELLGNLELLLTYSAGPGIRVVLELAPDIPNCLIDPSQFDAAVLNLVVNARDAMPQGGEIRISTERWVSETSIPDAPAPEAYVRVLRQGQRSRHPDGDGGEDLSIRFSRPRVRTAMVWDCRTCTNSCGGSAATSALPANGGGGRPSISCFPRSSRTGQSHSPRRNRTGYETVLHR